MSTSSHRRFALVSPNFYPRVCGVGDHTARLGAELRGRGHEVRVFSRSPVERHPEEPELEVVGSDARLPTAIAVEISRSLRNYRPTDVIFQYTSQMWNVWRFGSPAVVWLARQARKMGAETTLIAHELYVPWRARPDLALGALAQRAQLVALLKSCDHFFVTTATRAAGVVGLCNLLGLPLPKIARVGPNALPVERSYRAQPLAWVDGPRVGFFSTLSRGKRFDVVLGAFEEIWRGFPAAEMVILGDIGPPDDARAVEVRQSIARHPAAERIRLTGKLSLSDIAAEISKLDLYLFPMDTGANTRSGTLPVALGSGIPVVATFGQETDSALFRADENVALARDLSAPAFAEASLRLLRDPALLARVGDGARRLYEEHLSWPRIVDQLMAELSSAPR